MLCPHATLNTDNTLPAAQIHTVRIRCVMIDFFERCHGIGVIEIGVVKISHNHLSAVIRPMQGVFFSIHPALCDKGVAQIISLERIIPTNDFFTLLLQIRRHAVHHKRLQLFIVFQRMFFHHALASRAVCPVLFGHFVPAEVKILTGKNLAHFIDDFIEIFICFFIAGTQDIFKNALLGFHRHFSAATGDFGVSVNHCRRVPGNIQFRYNVNIALGAKAHHLAHLLLGIIALIAAIEFYPAEMRTRTHRTFLMQFRQGINLHAKSLVIR